MENEEVITVSDVERDKWLQENIIRRCWHVWDKKVKDIKNLTCLKCSAQFISQGILKDNMNFNDPKDLLDLWNIVLTEAWKDTFLEWLLEKWKTCSPFGVVTLMSFFFSNPKHVADALYDFGKARPDLFVIREWVAVPVEEEKKDG